MTLMPVSEALAMTLTGVASLGPEQVGLRLAHGRTLAHALTAALTHPPFDASAMDGYAVRSKDFQNGAMTLAITGEAAAGWPFGGTVGPGEAVRIFTGAPLPDGADTVVIQEDVVASGQRVTISQAPRSRDNVRPRGGDFHDGEIVVKRGQVLNARDILLAAASGHAMLAVVKRPVVAILATGDELVEPSDRPAAGQIVSSNSYGLAALVEAAGGTAKLLGIAKDTAEDLALKISEAEDADIVVTTGGASVGDHDLVRPAFEAAGATLRFHKIAMRPGKPTFFGTRPLARGGTQRIVGLPGNPLSAMISARLFLVPLIAAMLGRRDAPSRLQATLSKPITATGPREHYMRAIVDTSVSPPQVAPLASQDSSLVSILAAANALIVLPANTPALAAGAPVSVMPLDF
ncbi:MAG: molybdopterin molybdotransferase MoeA [Hyphomicrobium sp.]|nr:molybdopterin molybdotransferase MoeA [Hyphomicrobium sp.]